MTEILVIRPQSNQLGDTICTLPMYKALKEKYTDSRITLVGCPTNYAVDLKKLNPYLDEIIIYSRESYGVLFNFIKSLRGKKYDIVLVPSSIRMSYTSYVIALLAKGSLKAGVGRMDGEKNRLKFFLDVKPEYDWKKNRVHQVSRFLDSARSLGCVMTDDEAGKMRIELPEEDRRFADLFMSSNFKDKNRKVVGFHPGAGQKINTWNLHNYIELIKKIYESSNPYILISSGVIDGDITGRLRAALDENGVKYCMMSGISLFETAAVLSRLDLLVTNNTGIMHLASYCGTPTAAFFYKDDASEWGPFFRKGEMLESSSMDINEISVSAAYEKVLKYL